MSAPLLHNIRSRTVKLPRNQLYMVWCTLYHYILTRFTSLYTLISVFVPTDEVRVTERVSTDCSIIQVFVTLKLSYAYRVAGKMYMRRRMEYITGTYI